MQRTWLRLWIPLPIILCALIWIVSFGAAVLPHRATAQGLIKLELVVATLSNPLYVTHAGDGSGRLFIVEQTGRLLVFKNGALLGTPFLDIRTLISCCDERGLLSVAFHPRYRQNGFFYVDYTDPTGDTNVVRYKVSNNPDVANPAGARRLLFIEQPFPNHNGGLLKFGPDGYLYIGTGDGGAAGDPMNNAQNRQSFLGKILRVDVDRGATYGIPPTNPFVGKPGLDEIWASGLRNPWRFSFDRETGHLYIADVGQNRWEEIDFQPAASRGGENYGWRIMEGFHCYVPATNCNQTGLTLPISEYSHREGCSVTGGYVYRGRQISGLVGVYIYGDYCSGTIWGLRRTISDTWERTVLLQTDLRISSFGEDEAGELYVTDLNGAVYRISAP
jgi:glucose/arabinose dehydrogenase